MVRTLELHGIQRHARLIFSAHFANNKVFGLAGAAVMMSAVVFLLVFAFTYHITRPYAVNYVAIGIGIVSREIGNGASQVLEIIILIHCSGIHHGDQECRSRIAPIQKFQLILSQEAKGGQFCKLVL